ncbi:hypothetical protein HPB50_013748 [Hyalomma asiaticum]|uniref:Uncharacterized protein n=1 Tax=Hyalomma asiaticum TaxID=266040 RepID=A0ACB7TM99_HYAAI|nr:hypothetical protein HPB50_013748 [Hyalomma asiaticum]
MSADHEPLLSGDPGREHVPLRRRDLLRDPQDGQGTREEKVTKEPEYFESRCDRLYYPNLPCVQTGSAIQPLYLSLEVCGIVEGQHCKRELDENQTSEMIKRTGQASAKRFNEIRQSVQDLVNRSDQCLREHSVKITQPEPVRPAGQPREPQDAGERGRGHGDAHKGADGRQLGRHEAQADWHGRASRQGYELAKNMNYAEIKQVDETKIGLHTQCVMDNVE